MPAARLVAIVVVCACSAFAQQQSSISGRASNNRFEDYGFFASPPAANPSEPWRIIPERTQQEGSGQANSNMPLNDPAKLDAMAERAARLLASIPYDPNSQHLWVKFSPDGEIAGWGVDETCLSIRSYKVARDSKDSDATHPVSESTCLPASRYGVKSAVMNAGHSDQ
jgi:hypothetical protein